MRRLGRRRAFDGKGRGPGGRCVGWESCARQGCTPRRPTLLAVPVLRPVGKYVRGAPPAEGVVADAVKDEPQGIPGRVGAESGPLEGHVIAQCPSDDVLANTCFQVEIFRSKGSEKGGWIDGQLGVPMTWRLFPFGVSCPEGG